MKTNHRRGINSTTHRDQSMTGATRRLSGITVGASIDDLADGNRLPKPSRGDKKHQRTQERLDGKRIVARHLAAQATGEDLDDMD